MRWAKLVVVHLCHTLRTMRRARARFLFARYFVIVISCVVYFISSLAPERASLAERRLCVCHYCVAVSRSIAGRRPLWLRICFYNRYRAYFVKYFFWGH
jgi:hypothetical protein